MDCKNVVSKRTRWIGQLQKNDVETTEDRAKWTT